MVKILRARQAGTGSGGTGNPKAVPGVVSNTKEGAARDPQQLRAFASLRERAYGAISRSSIGSKGRL